MYLDTVERARLDEDDEARDAVDGLLQLVGPRVLLRRVLQVLGAERAQQQGEKEVQHLEQQRACHVMPVTTTCSTSC